MIYNIEHTPLELFIKDNTKKIDIDMVEQLYEGRGDCCRCGCGGNYYYPDKNLRKIKNALERMASGFYKVTSIDNHIFEIELETFESGRTRVQTLYLKQ
jgi:hypothetical protein